MTRTSSTRSGLVYVADQAPKLYRPSETTKPSRVTLVWLILPPAKLPSPAVVYPCGPVPAAVNTRSITLRVPRGRSRTVVSGSTDPTDDDVVAIKVSPATLTSIDCATPPTCNAKFKRTC